MLVTTIEEIDRLTAIGEGNSYESYSVDLENAEQDYVQPMLGEALYSDLLTKYQDNTITTEPDLTLLTLCQAVIANMAVATNLDQRQVSISDSGVQKGGDSAYYYQKIEAQNSFTRRAYRAMEQLLVFLEKKQADYASWKASDAYYLNRSFLIPTATDFQKHYNIRGSRRTYLAMLPVMKRVEIFSVIETLGQPFYDELLKTVQDSTELSAQQKTDNNALLTQYIRPAIAYLTVSESARELSMTLSADGLHLQENLAFSDKTIANKQANDQQLAVHAQQAADTGNQFLTRAINYLNAEATDTKFASYKLSPTWLRLNPGTDTPPEKPPGKLYGF
jgi:hypothetical protein